VQLLQASLQRSHTNLVQHLSGRLRLLLLLLARWPLDLLVLLQQELLLLAVLASHVCYSCKDVAVLCCCSPA
jgi:hypothetical protein